MTTLDDIADFSEPKKSDFIAKLIAEKRKKDEKDSKQESYYDIALEESSIVFSAINSMFNKAKFKGKKEGISFVLNPKYPNYLPMKMKVELIKGNKRNPFDVLKVILDILPDDVYEKNVDAIWQLLYTFHETDCLAVSKFWMPLTTLVEKITSSQTDATLTAKILAVVLGKKH